MRPSSFPQDRILAIIRQYKFRILGNIKPLQNEIGRVYNEVFVFCSHSSQGIEVEYSSIRYRSHIFFYSL